MIQAFDVCGNRLAVLQTQAVGSREDLRIRWHDLSFVDGQVYARFVGTDVCKDAGHPQTLNLNHKINIPWNGRKVTLKIGKPGLRSKPAGSISKRLPIASWSKTSSAARTATGTTETYYWGLLKKFTVKKPGSWGHGGVFQGATASSQSVFSVYGKTVDSTTSHKVRIVQRNWKGQVVKVLDVTEHLKRLGTSAEPEGLSFCKLPGDRVCHLYLGVRIGSVAKRRYVLFRVKI